ncbi:MAG: aminodeoxychorismate/anthranilate synthase component II [Bacteroidetes bacterium]|nr:aminodeoxychorismate/anthranilate synthase component II [Bacteroidota bacterium]
MKKIALIDNYDSFTYNLVHLVEKVSTAQVQVFLNDKVDLQTLSAFDSFILSPGPGLPKDAGIMPLLLEKFATQKNIFGVCLGMQAISERFGGHLKNLDTVIHGRATNVKHSANDFLFKDIPVNFTAGRYHSWGLDTKNPGKNIEITALDDNNEIMAIKHSLYNIRGVQFHPESILSEFGEVLLKNWTDNL